MSGRALAFEADDFRWQLAYYMQLVLHCCESVKHAHMFRSLFLLLCLYCFKIFFNFSIYPSVPHTHVRFSRTTWLPTIFSESWFMFTELFDTAFIWRGILREIEAWGNMDPQAPARARANVWAHRMMYARSRAVVFAA